jgi:hypothetical protein
MLIAYVSNNQSARCHSRQRRNIQIQRHEKFRSDSDLEFHEGCSDNYWIGRGQAFRLFSVADGWKYLVIVGYLSETGDEGIT